VLSSDGARSFLEEKNRIDFGTLVRSVIDCLGSRAKAKLLVEARGVAIACATCLSFRCFDVQIVF